MEHKNLFSYPIAKSKTRLWRKYVKPFLERERRNRINKSVNQLKDLMISQLNISDRCASKLEQADILEMTLNHLQAGVTRRRINTIRPGGSVTRIVTRNGHSVHSNSIKNLSKKLKRIKSASAAETSTSASIAISEEIETEPETEAAPLVATVSNASTVSNSDVDMDLDISLPTINENNAEEDYWRPW